MQQRLKIFFLFSFVALFSSGAFSQTLITYGNYVIDKEEFLRAYNKNKPATTDKGKAMQDYLQLYTNFKLKVKAKYNHLFDEKKKGSITIYVSFNTNKDLGEGNQSQKWSTPTLLLSKPGHIVWYPSLQPLNTAEDKAKKYTSLSLGQKARLFFKDMKDDKSPYLSTYIVEFTKPTP